MVERAPLRPVPKRPGDPVEPGRASRRVAARLPALDALARDALALITLSGRTRAEAAARLEVADAELAAALGRGRKALRRAAAPLAGSGWCERAELLISDRLDAALDARGAARLDVHLRNCPRCVEHERVLVAAIDALVGEAAEPEPAPSDVPAPVLRLADARPAAPPPSSVGKPPIASRPFGAPVAPARPGPAAEPPSPPARPAARPHRPPRIEPRPWPAQRIDPPVQPPGQPPGPEPAPPAQPPEQPPVEPPRPPGPEPAPPARPPEQPVEPPARPPEPAQETEPPAHEREPPAHERVPPAHEREPSAQEAEPPAQGAELPDRVAAAAIEPLRRSARELTVVATWHVLFALAVICAIAVIAITVWGASGGEL